MTTVIYSALTEEGIQPSNLHANVSFLFSLPSQIAYQENREINPVKEISKRKDKIWHYLFENKLLQISLKYCCMIWQTVLAHKQELDLSSKAHINFDSETSSFLSQSNCFLLKYTVVIKYTGHIICLCVTTAKNVFIGLPPPTKEIFDLWRQFRVQSRERKGNEKEREPFLFLSVLLFSFAFVLF